MSDNNVSRRSFVTGAAGLGAAALTAGWVTSAHAYEVEWDDECDVFVAGCGTFGAPGAIVAAEAGDDVYVIEKFDWLGGCMRRCGGGFFTAGTSVQEKLGVDDDPEMLYEYMIACAGRWGVEELIRTYVDRSPGVFEWIIAPESEGGLGGQPLEEWDFAPKGPDTFWMGGGLNLGGTPIYYEELGMPENYRPRCHWFNANPDDTEFAEERVYAPYAEYEEPTGESYGGTGLWKPFEDRLNKLENVRIDTLTELAGLVQDPDTKEILGAIIKQGDELKKVKARKGVLLATSTFNNNVDMYEAFTGREYKPYTIEQLWAGYFIDGQADGASIKAGLAAGAAMINPTFDYLGGLRTNAKAQVLDWDGNPIPRLYAGGRVTGGTIQPGYYPSCGALVAVGITYGVIAGEEVTQLEPLA